MCDYIRIDIKLYAVLYVHVGGFDIVEVVARAETGLQSLNYGTEAKSLSYFPAEAGNMLR